LDSNGFRVACYCAVAAASVLAGVREHRRARRNPNLWPTFWYLTAVLFLVMAVGRAGNVAELAADIGRREAQSAGWYDNRRKYQAMVVAAVAGTWFVAVVVALWRVPERRRRYLPMALVSFTIGCFAGVRTISLHQVDGLLYRRYLAGAKFGAVVEVALLAVAFAITFWQPATRLDRGPPEPRRRPQTIGQA
jgi:hypothetical protein